MRTIDERIGSIFVTSDMSDSMNLQLRRLGLIVVRSAELPSHRYPHQLVVERHADVTTSTVSRSMHADEDVHVLAELRGWQRREIASGRVRTSETCQIK